MSHLVSSTHFDASPQVSSDTSPIREQPGSFFQPKHLKTKASPAPGRARSSWACRSAPSAAGSSFPGQSTFALHRAQTTRAVRRPEELCLNAPQHKTTGSTAERKQGCVGDRQLLEQTKIPILHPNTVFYRSSGNNPGRSNKEIILWEDQAPQSPLYRIFILDCLRSSYQTMDFETLNPSLRKRPQESLLAVFLLSFWRLI